MNRYQPRIPTALALGVCQEKYRREANYYRDILFKLGFPVYGYSRVLDGDVRYSGCAANLEKADAEMKERLEYLTKSGDVLQAIDMEDMEFSLRGCEMAVKELRDAIGLVRELRGEKKTENAIDTPAMI